MGIIKQLFDFIEKAQKSRKYLPNTATSYRSPLRLIEPELTDEEKESIDLFKKNLDQIFNTLYNKNGSLSAASLEVYKRRVRSLISDYEKYGKDPSAMANWNRPIVTRKLKDKPEKKESKTEESVSGEIENLDTNVSTQTAIVTLTNGKAKIVVPSELTEIDVKKLKAQINVLANIYDEG
jgi:hypothetical protein